MSPLPAICLWAVLLDSFRKEPWLGFEVVGIYHDAKPGGVPSDWAGNYDQLIDDAKAGKIHNVYIAMQMKEESRIKKLMRDRRTPPVP